MTTDRRPTCYPPHRPGAAAVDPRPAARACPADPHDLARFVRAQDGGRWLGSYAQALAEVRAGYKRTCWMWYVFPCYARADASTTSAYYAVRTVAEAEAYLSHPLLGARLREVAGAALAVLGAGRTAADVFGAVDADKLRRCADLFAFISPAWSVFHQLLTKLED